MNGSESDKLVIGLYGEMRLVIELHKRGWQVYRAYIDEKSDVERFDNLELDTYQITDNQKTTLRINRVREVVNKGRTYDFSVFENFHNNFECLEELIEGDSWK